MVLVAAEGRDGFSVVSVAEMQFSVAGCRLAVVSPLRAKACVRPAVLSKAAALCRNLVLPFVIVGAMFRRCTGDITNDKNIEHRSDH
jgi:hypothetical protein